MARTLMETADHIMHILSDIPGIKNCTLYGSLSSGNYDELSDIDIEIYVSDRDNGVFALELPDMLRERMPVYYADYAPSLAPEKYVVSIAFDETNPFRMADICVKGEPHFSTVTRRQLADRNDMFTHTLKLLTANLKHHLRGADCRGDIVKMASRLGIPEIADKSDAALLSDTLEWLESNVPEHLRTFLTAFRKHFGKLS